METFLGTLGQVFARVVEVHGVAADGLLREAGIDPAALRDPSSRIPSDAADRVGAKAAALIGDPAFGLHAARCWHPSHLGALGHAWLASSTLRTGLQRLERYARVMGERARLGLASSRAGLRFVYDHRRRDPVLRAVGTDFVLSLVFDMCRMNYGAALRPLEVRLTRAKPGDPGPWTRHYGCPVRFEAADDGFLLATRVADEVLPTANRQLAATFDGILAAQLAALDRDNVPARCKAALLEQLTSGEVSEGAMAKTLNMSRRTLQRKLAESQLSYQRLVDDTRRDLALRYLGDPRNTVTDVTFLLGFSAQSAFTRAFRRWTGVAPTQWRAGPGAVAAA